MVIIKFDIGPRDIYVKLSKIDDRNKKIMIVTDYHSATVFNDEQDALICLSKNLYEIHELVTEYCYNLECLQSDTDINISDIKTSMITVVPEITDEELALPNLFNLI